MCVKVALSLFFFKIVAYSFCKTERIPLLVKAIFLGAVRNLSWMVRTCKPHSIAAVNEQGCYQ
jgi:hypothetical protein